MPVLANPATGNLAKAKKLAQGVRPGQRADHGLLAAALTASAVGQAYAQELKHIGFTNVTLKTGRGRELLHRHR